ncbi:MAG: hypothetical protein ABIA67_05900 [Candidatus Margulisiibacteriota bacterium]
MTKITQHQFFEHYQYISMRGGKAARGQLPARQIRQADEFYIKRIMEWGEDSEGARRIHGLTVTAQQIMKDLDLEGRQEKLQAIEQLIAISPPMLETSDLLKSETEHLLWLTKGCLRKLIGFGMAYELLENNPPRQGRDADLIQSISLNDAQFLLPIINHSLAELGFQVDLPTIGFFNERLNQLPQLNVAFLTRDQVDEKNNVIGTIGHDFGHAHIEEGQRFGAFRLGGEGRGLVSGVDPYWRSKSFALLFVLSKPPVEIKPEDLEEIVEPLPPAEQALNVLVSEAKRQGGGTAATEVGSDLGEMVVMTPEMKAARAAREKTEAAQAALSRIEEEARQLTLDAIVKAKQGLSPQPKINMSRADVQRAKNIMLPLINEAIQEVSSGKKAGEPESNKERWLRTLLAYMNKRIEDIERLLPKDKSK